MPRFYIPGVPRGTEPEELERLERLVADLRAYCSGATPTRAEVSAAPSVSWWHPIQDHHSFRLAGQVVGHPSVGPGLGVTSQVFAADVEGRWCRSWSRLWRLGPPADGSADTRN